MINFRVGYRILIDIELRTNKKNKTKKNIYKAETTCSLRRVGVVGGWIFEARVAVWKKGIAPGPPVAPVLETREMPRRLCAGFGAAVLHCMGSARSRRVVESRVMEASCEALRRGRWLVDVRAGVFIGPLERTLSRRDKCWAMLLALKTGSGI